jgi:hypothetical protein
MAYRNFSETLDGGTATKTSISASLTPIEWLIAALAQRDPLSSVEKPGRIAMMLGMLFGDRPSPQLADPRLEALRRFAVLVSNLGDRLPGEETARFLAAGFSRAQAELVRQSMTAR